MRDVNFPSTRRGPACVRPAVLLLTLPPAAWAEVPEPFPHWAMNPPPVEKAFPAFARNDPCTIRFAATLHAPVDRVWKVMRQQPELLNSMTMVKQIYNLTGGPGDWQITVQMHTPSMWHRWTRTEVRKFVTLDDEKRSLSYFHSEGFGLWMPRAAFRETVDVHPDNENNTLLDVEAWYELDDEYIGWPTGNLINETNFRIHTGYVAKHIGYVDEVQDYANGKLNFTGRTLGPGRYMGADWPEAIAAGRRKKHIAVSTFARENGFGMGENDTGVPAVREEL